MCAILAQPARIMNGSTDALKVAPAANINNLTALTVCAWIYLIGVDGGGYGTIYWKGDGSALMVFRVGPTQRLEMYITKTVPAIAYTSDNTVPATSTVWMYACASYASSDGGPRAWIGAPGGSVAEASYFLRTDGSGTHNDDAADGVFIGCRGNGAETLNGIIGEVRVFNTALTAAEMTSLLRGYPVKPGNQLAYWPLQGRASPEPDRGPSGYNLTLTGTTGTGSPPIAPSFGWWNVAKFFHLQAPWLG